MMRLDGLQKARLDQLVRDTLEARRRVKPPANDEAWDSHTLVEMIFAAEAVFDLTLSSAEMEAVLDCASLESVIARRLLDLVS